MIMPPPSHPPAVLYKYYPPERIDVLDNGFIRFTSPTQFNDTFDTDCGTSSPIMQMMQRHGLGIFCMTEDPDNYLMWVHYAAQHTGLVVGFRTSYEIFHETGARLAKVLYRPKPRARRRYSQEEALNLAFRKSSAWSYEKEWRCVQHFKRGKSRDVYFDPAVIAEVVVGSQMDQRNITKVLQLLTEFDHDVLVSESQPIRASWSFTHEPTVWRLCPECKGAGIRHKAHLGE